MLVQNEVSEFSPQPADGAVVFDFNVERCPRPGSRYEVVFGGWVVSRETRLTSVCVSIAGGPILLHSGLIARQDVADHFPELDSALKSGFWASVNLLLLPAQVTLVLSVCGIGGEPLAELGRITVSTRFEKIPVPTELTPVMICTEGRSGSTVLMRGLGRHPEFATHDRYPYEVQYFQYCTHAAAVQTGSRPSPVDRMQDKFYSDRASHMCPYHHRVEDLDGWFIDKHIPQTLSHWFRQGMSFYRDLAARDGKPRAQFFAEKSTVDNRELQVMRNAGFPPKVLLLIRDPRDTAASWLKYKRGDVNAASQVTPAVFMAEVEQLVEMFKRMAAFVREKPYEMITVRYEEMMTKPAEVARAILTFCGADASEEAVQAVADGIVKEDEALRAHRTTASVSESFGNWRRSLLPWQQAFAGSMLAQAVADFGYEPAAVTIAPATETASADSGDTWLPLDLNVATPV